MRRIGWIHAQWFQQQKEEKRKWFLQLHGFGLRLWCCCSLLWNERSARPLLCLFRRFLLRRQRLAGTMSGKRHLKHGLERGGALENEKYSQTSSLCRTSAFQQPKPTRSAKMAWSSQYYHVLLDTTIWILFMQVSKIRNHRWPHYLSNLSLHELQESDRLCIHVESFLL